jgi:hypothetical protein
MGPFWGKDSMRVELDAKIASGYHSDKVEAAS